MSKMLKMSKNLKTTSSFVSRELYIISWFYGIVHVHVVCNVISQKAYFVCASKPDLNSV